jgi:hypothetical protein
VRASERRVRERLAARRTPEPGLLDALCGGVLERLPDGSALFSPWGALGPSYRVPAGARLARLRRGLRMLLAAGLLAPPGAALLAAQSGRLAPACWLAGATGAGSLLALALLTRGLARSGRRVTAREARARVAAALGDRALRRARSAALGVALVALATSVAWSSAIPAAASGAALVVSALLELRRRVHRRRGR